MYKATQETYIHRDTQIATLWDHWTAYVSAYAQTGLRLENATILKRNLQFLCERFNPKKPIQENYYDQMKTLIDLQIGTKESLIAMTIRSKASFTQEDINLLRLIGKQITADDILFCLIFLAYAKQIDVRDTRYFSNIVLPKCGLARRDNGNYPLLANDLLSGRSPRHMVSFLLAFVEENISCNMNSSRLNELYRTKANAVKVLGGLFCV